VELRLRSNSFYIVSGADNHQEDGPVSAPWKQAAEWGHKGPSSDPADGGGWNEEWPSDSEEEDGMDEMGEMEPPSINLLQEAMDSSLPQQAPPFWKDAGRDLDGEKCRSLTLNL